MVSLLFTLASGLLLGTALAQPDLSVPNPFGNYTQNQQSWTIKSKRSYWPQETGSTQLVAEEHYLFAPLETTYHGYYSRDSKNYIHLLRNGKTYESIESTDKGEDDQLQRRCSPLHSVIKWPWRYQSLFDKSFMVLGIGAVWLNAINMKESFQCSQLNDKTLQCTMETNGTSIQLNFNNKSYLVSGYVEDKPQNKSKPKPSKIQFQVEVLKDYADEEALKDIENLMKLCELASDVRFPSLLTELLDTRFWSQSYVARRFDVTTGSELSQSSIREEFDYDASLQAFFEYTEPLGMEMYFRNMSFHWTLDGMLRTMTYKIVDRSCIIQQFHNEILNGEGKVHLTKRKLHFRNDQSGYLIGLSALFMNMADVRNKRVAVDGSIVNNKWCIEWVIGDRYEFQWYLRFPANAYKDDQALFQQWDTLELRKVSKRGGKGALIASYKHVPGIAPEMPSIQLFELPESCPSIEDYTSTQSEQDNKVAEVETGEEQQKDEEGEEQESSEFPLLSQILNLEESYLMSSDWDFGNGTTLHLTERQLLQVEPGDDDGQLLSRFDVIVHHGANNPTSYTLFIQHATGAVIKATSSGCQQISAPDQWLRLNELDEPDFNETVSSINIDEWTPKPVGLYGIFALWKQAELSTSLQFISGTQTWRMTLYGDKVVVEFSFITDEELNKPKLSSIIIDTSRMPHLFEDVKKISIKFITFQHIPPSGFHFVLPSHCDSKMMHESHYPSPKFRFPAFQDKFNGLPTSVPFKFDYQLQATFDGVKKFCRVVEMHNPDLNIGLSTLRFLKGDSINIWAQSGQHTLMDWKRECKPTRDIAQIFEIEDWLFKDNKLFKAESTNFLLANAWQLISARAEPNYPIELAGGMEISVKSRQHSFNKKFQPISVDWTLKNLKNNLSIKFTFLHTNSSSPPALQSVHFLNDTGHAKFHMLIISMSNELVNLTIPERCTKEVAFPKLNESNPDASRQISHLRSEFSLKDSYASNYTGQFFMVDEWLYQNINSEITYRLTTRGLGSEEDYLVSLETGELFDLSKIVSGVPKCETFNLGPCLDVNTVWLNDRLVGPLWTWLMVERYPHHLRVSKSLDTITLQELMSLPELDLFIKMKSQTWEVSSAAGGHDTTFHFNSASDGSTSWFELDQLNVWHSFHKLQLERQQILVQTVSFVSKPFKDEQYSDKLMIPKGIGCRRTSFAKQHKTSKLRDVIVYGSTSPSSFRYYSYLKLAQNGSTVLNLRPVIHEGTVSLCPAIWFTIPIGSIRVNYQRDIPLNGSQPISWRKLVTQGASSKTDAKSKQLYTLDERSGQCLIKRQEEDELLRLQFELPTEQQVVLDTDFFEKLLASKGFELIQSKKGVARVYEKDWSNVNLTSVLSGPAIITRTFEFGAQFDSSVYGGLWYHTSVNIEISWPNRALLYLKISDLKFKDCHDIIRDARPEECTQTSEMLPKQKIRYYRFRIVQSDSKIQHEELMKLKRTMEINLKESLISHFESRLSLVQFGQSSIEIDQKETLTFVLCLSFIEPPEPIEYFEQVEDRKLTNQRLVKMKALENEFACSDWCASNGCRAFSYCSSDRVCRIVETFDWSESNPSGCCQLASEQGCGFWKASNGILRVPIRALMAELREDVAKEQFSIKWISMGARFTVVDMKELNGLLEEDDEQEQQQQQQQDNATGLDTLSFLLVKPNARLVLTEQNSNQFKETRELKLADCMRSCSGSGCQLFSYCPDDRACTMLVNLDSYSSYSINMNATLPNERCSTYSEDFVANYKHFSLTTKPNSSELELADLSLQECAARCDLGAGGDTSQAFVCVAFDYCQLVSGDQDRADRKCYLQALHVTMEDFDESVLAKPETTLATTDSSMVCSHYSSTFLRDFVPHFYRRFEKHSIFTYGLDLERCAMLCRAHRETCLAFEHCHGNTFSKDTCFMHHLEQQRIDSASNCTGDTCYSADHLQDNSLLIVSDNCTVYESRLKASDRWTAGIEPGASVSEPGVHSKLWLFTLHTISYAIVAMLVGLVVQIAYIRCH